jgi:hypothetical protein
MLPKIFKEMNLAISADNLPFIVNNNVCVVQPWEPVLPCRFLINVKTKLSRLDVLVPSGMQSTRTYFGFGYFHLLSARDSLQVKAIFCISLPEPYNAG